MSLDNAVVYVGGKFTGCGSLAAGGFVPGTSYLAKYSQTSLWSAVGTVNGKVNALLVDTVGNLILGGAFTFSGSFGQHVLRYNVTSSSFQNMASGLNGDVLALTIDPRNGYIYAGGNFYLSAPSPGQVIRGLSYFDNSQWIALGKNCLRLFLFCLFVSGVFFVFFFLLLLQSSKSMNVYFCYFFFS
jgi:hypothetical protein